MIVWSTLQLERKKKAMMRMRLDEFVGEQPEQHSEANGFDNQQQAWGRRDSRSYQQVLLSGEGIIRSSPYFVT